MAKRELLSLLMCNHGGVCVLWCNYVVTAISQLQQSVRNMARLKIQQNNKTTPTIARRKCFHGSEQTILNSV